MKKEELVQHLKDIRARARLNLMKLAFFRLRSEERHRPPALFPVRILILRQGTTPVQSVSCLKP